MLSHWFNHDNFEMRLKNYNSLSQKMNPENYLKVPGIPSCLLVQQQQTPQINTSSSSLNSNGPSSLQQPAALSNNSNTGSNTNNAVSGNHRGSGTNLRESGCNLIRVPWKVVLLGDAGVGKSSLVRQFLNGCFSTVYNPTVEDSYQHNIRLPDGASQCIEIMDTSGFYQFPAMRELNIRLGAAFLLVFDVVKEETLTNLISLHKEIISIKGSEKVPMILVGNKTDLSSSPAEAKASEKVIKQAQVLAQSTFKCPFVETSAKENLNVERIFTLVVEQVYRELEAALEALNAAANADGSGSGGNGRRNSTISFVVRRISSTNLTVKPIERLSRRFSEPVACVEAAAGAAAAAAAAAGSATAQPANSLMTVADPTANASLNNIKAVSNNSIQSGGSGTNNKSMKHSSSREQQSSAYSGSTRRKTKNCVIS